jgi:hypothetical protein
VYPLALIVVYYYHGGGIRIINLSELRMKLIIETLEEPIDILMDMMD